MELTSEMITAKYADQTPAMVCEQCANERNTQAGTKPLHSLAKQGERLRIGIPCDLATVFGRSKNA